MFTSRLYRWTFSTWPFFACLTVMSFVYLVISIALAVVCRLNFGKGLAPYRKCINLLSYGHLLKYTRLPQFERIFHTTILTSFQYLQRNWNPGRRTAKMTKRWIFLMSPLPLLFQKRARETLQQIRVVSLVDYQDSVRTEHPGRLCWTTTASGSHLRSHNDKRELIKISLETNCHLQFEGDHLFYLQYHRIHSAGDNGDLHPPERTRKRECPSLGMSSWAIRVKINT